MKRKIVYTDAPFEIEEALERAVTVEDFLPPPSQLVRRGEQRDDAAFTKRRAVSTLRQRAYA